MVWEMLLGIIVTIKPDSLVLPLQVLLHILYDSGKRIM